MTTPMNDLHARLPHVDHDWASQAMTELALRDVSGTDIGAALLEVESHMAEHGGEVREVFGDPKAYAAALELPDTAKLSGKQWAGVWLPAIVMFLGVSLLLNGVMALLGGGGLSLLSVSLVLLVFVAAAGAIVRFDLIRLLVSRPVLSGLVLVVLIGGVGVLASLVPGPEWEFAPAVSIPVGVVLFFVGLLLLLRLKRRAEANQVTFPGV